MNNLSRIALLVILTLNTISVSQAYSLSSSSYPTSSFNLENLFRNQQIFNPLTDFINSAEQIGSTVGSNISKYVSTAPTGNLNVASWFDRANNWVSNATGLSLLGLLKDILNIVIWILEKILGIFKWFESVI